MLMEDGQAKIRISILIGQMGEAAPVSYYEVFRASKRLGAYDRERVARSRGQLDEVSAVTAGTVAADAIRRLAKAEGPGANVLRRKARFWCSVVAAHIRREFTQEQATRLGRLWGQIEPLAPYAERGGEKRVVGLWYKVPGPPDMSGVVLLSILFGTQAKRLGLCAACSLPFVTDAAHPQRRICYDCRPERQHGLKAWLLGPALRKAWDRVQHRWAQRVYVGTMTRAERDSQRRQALGEIRRVKSGEMTVEEWLMRWDQGTKQRVGRRSKATGKQA